jgi:hypothetical protein
MDSTYFWHKLNLLGQKSITNPWAALITQKTFLLRASLLCLVLSILGVNTTQAQGFGYFKKHMEHYEDRTLHYGFYFAAPSTSFNIRRSENFVQKDSIYSITSPNTPGFTVGFLMNFRLSNRLDVRLSPMTVSIYGRQVEYKSPGRADAYPELRESTWVEFPIMLKYKSERRKNTRMYLLGGCKFGLEANVRKKESPSYGRLSTKTSDFSIEYGVGLERFFEYFKFAPELRFSHGLTNLFVPNKSPFSQGIDRLSSHTVTLYLMFE